MRESRQSGSEGGAAQLNAPFLPLSPAARQAGRQSFVPCGERRT